MMLIRVRVASLGAAVAKYFCKHHPSLPRFLPPFRHGFTRPMHTAEMPSPYQTSGRYADVSRDVVLYSFPSVRFYRWMTLFGAVQFVFWAQMGHFSFQNYLKASKRKERTESARGTASQLSGGPAGADIVKTVEASPNSLQKGENSVVKDGNSPEKSEPSSSDEKAIIEALDKPQKWYVKYVMGQMDYNRPYYSLTVGLLYYFVGAGLAYAAMMFALRSVAQLILHKGGQTITIITYAPFGFTRKFTIPTDDITTKWGRQGARAYLPLKIRGRPLYYLLDMRGTFHNPTLFDVTAGLQRSWRK